MEVQVVEAYQNHKKKKIKSFEVTNPIDDEVILYCHLVIRDFIVF